MLVKNENKLNLVLSLGVVLFMVACGSEDHSGRYEGTEFLTQNGITETNNVSLELTQNQDTVNGVYSTPDSSGILIGNVNKKNPDVIENVSMTVTTKKNYIPYDQQMQLQPYGVALNPYGLNNTNTNTPVDIQRNQQAYQYQQYAQQNGISLPNQNNGLYGIPNGSVVNCSGAYNGNLNSNGNISGNLTMPSNDQCGTIFRTLNLRKTVQK